MATEIREAHSYEPFGAGRRYHAGDLVFVWNGAHSIEVSHQPPGSTPFDTMSVGDFGQAAATIPEVEARIQSYIETADTARARQPLMTRYPSPRGGSEGSPARAALGREGRLWKAIREAGRVGRLRGQAAGSWVLDGNSSQESARKLLQGWEDGDPEVMDIQPSPLSGEYADDPTQQSLLRELGYKEADFPDEADDIATAYEQAYGEGFWDEVLSHARAIAGAGWRPRQSRPGSPPREELVERQREASGAPVSVGGRSRERYLVVTNDADSKNSEPVATSSLDEAKTYAERWAAEIIAELRPDYPDLDAQTSADGRRWTITERAGGPFLRAVEVIENPRPATE